ncbi:hypothetical protein [Actinocatenispora rupis]|uniref:Mce-associated membrane protein n=1 Tax=Actinocatenispora rupis TaxID=519421 RepID=A0A8J3JH03_9ACTN|nr:hypothetical protein [Actinocatenispora rupis]GID16227.1 hypothetical protein Aru02nite_71160 [Actinocatenispora rupis]
MRTTALRWLVAGAAATLLLSGCGASTDKAQQAKSSATPSASARTDRASAPPTPKVKRGPLTVRMTPVKLSARQKEAADTVFQYWSRYGVAVSTRDVDGSGLALVLSARKATAGTTKVVDALKAKNEKYVGVLVLGIRSVGVGTDTATVDTCVDQSRSRLTDSNGQTVQEPEKQNILPIAHTLVKRNGTWLVDKIDQGGFTC